MSVFLMPCFLNENNNIIFVCFRAGQYIFYIYFISVFVMPCFLNENDNIMYVCFLAGQYIYIYIQCLF